jgi:DNA-binding CsgD family transcriptional regulator/sugar-specific transcriptional regulator TrmB
MGDQAVMSSLEVLGLDAEADAIYRALLQEGSHTRTSLAAQLGLPDHRVDSALAALCAASLVHIFHEPGETVRPADPQLGFSAALAQHRVEIIRRQEDVERAEIALAGLVARYEQLRTHRLQEVEVLGDADVVRTKVAELTAAADKEVVGLFATDQSKPPHAMQKGIDQNALNRDVILRRIHLDSIRNHVDIQTYAEWLTSAGAMVRTVPVLPLAMMVFDGTTAILPLDPDVVGTGAIVVQHPGVIAALLLAFESSWESAQPFSREVERDEAGLRPSDRELIRLLADGLTDEATARKMGVSLRTVRRMSASLMSKLNARSRFQAGYQAAKRGWL